ncbi:MAG: tyrosine-type recombinase/integrase [Lewinellaceae bacterium]|nr:tyrosine-type recombinase/integrase [Lewinellaceae bacterium]
MWPPTCYTLTWNAKLSQSQLNSAYSGIKLLFVQVLGREWDSRLLPRSRREKRLPAVLSVVEALALVNTPRNLKHRTILRLLYACGLRVSEALALQVSDVDSQRMVLVVRQGKGFKDRQVPLSESILESLRQYYRAFRPRKYLFESGQTGGPLIATFGAGCIPARKDPNRRFAQGQRTYASALLCHAFARSGG